MSVYFDACVLVPIFLHEESSSRVNAFLDGLELRIHLSDLGVAEFSSAISRRVRMGDDGEATARDRMSAFDEWVIAATTLHAIEPADIRRAGALVRNFSLKLLTPDAIHLAACERLSLTLATLDGRLALAARELAIQTIVPE